MQRSFVVLGIVALMVPGCGDDTPASPTTVTRPLLPPQVSAGAVLSFVSGESGAPVPNARVLVAGKTFAADADGQLELPEPFDLDSPLDILAPEFLDRQTRLRDPATSTRYPLWPRTSPTGLTEKSTFELTYRVLDGARPMMRILPGTREAFIVPSPAIRRDSRSMDTIRRSAEAITDITDGEIQFIVADEAPAGAVVFDLVIDPGDPVFAGSAAAVARRRLRGWNVTGGTVVYVALGTVRTSTTSHELGHMFGLAHSSNLEDVMHGTRRSPRSDFSAREALTMRLMLKRPPGNEMPDNDRNASASSLRELGESWESVVDCR